MKTNVTAMLSEKLNVLQTLSNAQTGNVYRNTSFAMPSSVAGIFNEKLQTSCCMTMLSLVMVATSLLIYAEEGPEDD